MEVKGCDEVVGGREGEREKEREELLRNGRGISF
jgi:hypothetical protein